MRHFIYEIDERNLRVKLKDIEQPLKEGAWENFEEFSGGQHKRNSESGVKFKFSLNRNAVLLGVFATVIISFSFLLFNFISIKNPKTSARLEEPAVATPTETAPEKPAPAPEKIVTVVTKTVAVKEPEPVKAELVAETKTVAPEPVPVVEKAVEVPKAAPKEEVKPDAEELTRRAEEAAKKAEEFERKRQKREAAALAKKIKPTVVTEDTEPDVKPE